MNLMPLDFHSSSVVNQYIILGQAKSYHISPLSTRVVPPTPPSSHMIFMFHMPTPPQSMKLKWFGHVEHVENVNVLLNHQADSDRFGSNPKNHWSSAFSSCLSM